MTDSTLIRHSADHAGPAADSRGRHTRRLSRSTRHFIRHYAEMVAVMFAGMAVLWLPAGWALGAVGSSWSELTDTAPSLRLLGMAITMTVPMVGWMRVRGHPTRHSVEMGASMIVPTAVVIVLYWLSAVPAHGVMMIEHSVMIPAMLLVMLLRYEHYSR